jgi:hypothetical protein
LREHVLPLAGQAIEQQSTFRTCVNVHSNTLNPYEASARRHVAALVSRVSAGDVRGDVA